MKNVNPNGAAAEYDFATANRYKTARSRKTDVSKSVYAQDADGVCYYFKTITEAAQAVLKNGYCRTDMLQSIVEGNIHRAAYGLLFPNTQQISHRMFGFDWKFTSAL